MSKFTRVAPVDPATHPGFQRLYGAAGFEKLTEARVEEFLGAPGMKLVAFADDPNVQKETLDMVVIAPELERAFHAGLSGAWFSDVTTGRALAARWGVKRLPAVGLFRGSVWLGAVEGLKNWDEYVTGLTEIGSRTSAPPRSISILPSRPEPSSCG